MIKDDSIEAVYIATDAPSHARLAAAALEHGKHVASGGHDGSHGYLMSEFVDAILRDRKPWVDIAQSLNMTVAPNPRGHLTLGV